MSGLRRPARTRRESTESSSISGTGIRTERFPPTGGPTSGAPAGRNFPGRTSCTFTCSTRSSLTSTGRIPRSGRRSIKTSTGGWRRAWAASGWTPSSISRSRRPSQTIPQTGRTDCPMCGICWRMPEASESSSGKCRRRHFPDMTPSPWARCSMSARRRFRITSGKTGTSPVCLTSRRPSAGPAKRAGMTISPVFPMTIRDAFSRRRSGWAPWASSRISSRITMSPEA